MELAYWLAVCIATGLLGVCVRRHELDESLLCGLLISCLFLLVAIKKGFVGIDTSAIPIAMIASLMLGYASYGLYEQNKEELEAARKGKDT